LDIYSFLADVIPEKPTAPSLESLLGATVIGVIVAESGTADNADITATYTLDTKESGALLSEAKPAEQKKEDSVATPTSTTTTTDEKATKPEEKLADDKKSDEKKEECATSSATTTSDEKAEEKKSGDDSEDEKKEKKREWKDYTNVQEILLTGVSGYLGIYLLVELLAAYRFATIHCLMRAKSPQDAKSRFDAQLAKYEIKLSQYDLDRVTFVLGDLAKPKLAIAEDIYNTLLDKVRND